VIDRAAIAAERALERHLATMRAQILALARLDPTRARRFLHDLIDRIDRIERTDQ
jgi:hypothetical protein